MFSPFKHTHTFSRDTLATGESKAEFTGISKVPVMDSALPLA